MQFSGGLHAIHTLLRAVDCGRVAFEVLLQRDVRHVRGNAMARARDSSRWRCNSKV